jgi:ABC-2 type transport system permease protein
MKTGLLFVDELRGFYKSKVMVFLWIGLPIISLLFRFISAGSSGQNISFTLISALIVSSIGGTLASVMLAVFIINEKNRHVYDLFLIRPLKRRDIILAKFFSVYTCIAIASSTILSNAGQSLVTSLSMIAVSCAVGVLIGVASPSVLVGAILVIYGGNQISVIPLIPTILNIQEATIVTILLAVAVASGLLFAAVAIFENKQF